MDKQTGIRIGTPEDLSLNGSLRHFFARKGIIFDQDTGLFRVENDYTKQIRLLGHGQKYAMIRKALLRNGIMASRNIESDFCIEVIGDEINVSEQGQCFASVYTIEQLLEKIAIE